ncbi:MAG: hypothetical protein MUE75_12730 [Algoriphagus sp.]|jgi:hypothetical protein|nr:hypothetical protein [Algoriphagus sp.]
MDRKGILIWIVGLVVLGLLAAYLFNQSQQNQKQLNLQASRNVLMMREALGQSQKDLKKEINSFIYFKLALNSKDSLKKHAAQAQGRDPKKFAFFPDSDKKKSLSFGDAIHIPVDLADLQAEGLGLIEIHEALGIGKTAKGSENHLYTEVPYESWLRELIRSNTFFDQVILALDSGKVVYPSHLKGTSLNDDKKSISERFVNKNIGQFEMEYNAKPHLGYAVPLVEGQQKLWVIGMKDKEDLINAAYRVDYTAFTLIALGMLLLLTATPIISFFGMDKGDLLTQRRVYYIGFSLLMLFAVGGWTLGYVFYKPFGSEIEDEISKEVKDELRKSLRIVIDHLDSTQIGDSVEIQLNELLEADSSGKIRKYVTQDIASIDGKTYDFSFISIAHRNYFSFFQKSDTGDKAKKLFIERIFSQKDGKAEMVISRSKGDNVQAVSFLLDSTRLTQDRRYLLVKQAGDVVFSSQQFEIPFSNLKSVLPEEKWELFQNLTSQRALDSLTWDLPIHINGQEYDAKISPMQMPGDSEQVLWFIYLVNKNSYHLKAGLISIASMGFLAFYVFFFGALTQIPRVSIPKKNNWKTFALYWLLPRAYQHGNHKLAAIALSIVIFLTFVAITLGWVYEQLPFDLSLLVIVSTPIGVCTGMYFLVRSDQSNDSNKSHYFYFVFSFLLVAGFIPGFVIFKQVNTLENQLWSRSLEQSIQPLNKKVEPMYLARMGFMTGLATPYDGQIVRYFMPQSEDFENAYSGKKIAHYSLISSPSWKSWTIGSTLMALVLAFLGVRSLVRKMFWMDFQIEEENALANIIENELSGCPNLRIFLCGCDSMVNRYWVYSTFKLDRNEVYLIDCAEEGLKLPKPHKLEKVKVLLIEDIHCLNDLSQFMQEIPALLGLARDIHLVFSAGTSWRSLVSKLGSDVEKVRFSELMSGFYFEFVPIIPETKSTAVRPRNYFSEMEVEDYFRKREIIGLEEEKPYARLLLQRYGKAYFYNVWSELSIEEKNVCYAYAMEGFINPMNYEEVVELYQKGVFINNWSGKSLRLFSKTFRYFVISTISTNTKNQLTAYRKRYSTANNVQWAVLSFLILAIGLLAYFERSFFTEIQAMVTGVLGFVGFLVGQAKKFFQIKGLE